MKILLDTHVLLWALTDDPKLSNKARELIEMPENDIYYSILSLWEIKLKHMLHSDLMPVGPEEVSQYCQASGILELNIRKEHIFRLSELKRPEGLPSHKDPFDRLLICQAASENMLFLTHDSRILEYDEPCILGI